MIGGLGRRDMRGAWRRNFRWCCRRLQGRNVGGEHGRERSGVDVLEWVDYGETSGAGEILLTSDDREGTSRGFDISLTKAVTERVEIPVIASGGMGCDKDLIDVVKVGGVDAVAMAHVLHYGKCYLRDLREKCRVERIPVRVTDC